MYLLTVKCVDGSMQVVGYHEDFGFLKNYATETLQAKHVNIDIINHVGTDDIMIKPELILKKNEELKGYYKEKSQ